MLLNYDYYEENQEKLNQLPKIVQDAIGVIVNIDNGNNLVSTKRTEKMTSISRSTVHMYNEALMKDISDSYNLTIQALEILSYREDTKSLIAKNPTFLDEEIVIMQSEDSDNPSVNIFTKKEILYLSTIPSEYISMKDNTYELSTRDYYYDRSKKLGDIPREKRIKLLGQDSNKMHLYKENKLFSAKSIQVEAPEPIVFTGGVSYGKRSINIKDYKGTLETSLKIKHANSIFQKTSNISLDDALAIFKRVKLFTYGYNKDSEHLDIGKNTRYLDRNKGYNNSVKKGRGLIDSVEEQYYKNISLIQTAIDTSMNPKDALSVLTEKSDDNNFAKDMFHRSIVVSFSEANTKEPSLKEIVTIHNIAYSSFMKAINETANKHLSEPDLNLGHNISSEEAAIRNMVDYVNAQKMVDFNMGMFKKISNSILIDPNQVHDNEAIRRSLLSRTRASLLDNKIDSYIVNNRSDRTEKEPKYSDNVVVLMGVDEKFRKMIQSLDDNPYHDYYEFDNEFIKTSGIDYLTKWGKALKNLGIPVKSKTAMRFRMTGNYNAIGVYFSYANTIAEDFRHLRSYIHELTHHIDISSNLNKLGRKNLVSTLYDYFSPKINDKKDYYLSDPELIARAGEVSFYMQLGSYDKLREDHKKGLISKEELLNKVQENFKNHELSFLMEKLETYTNSNVYIDVAAEINNNRFELLDHLQEYFKSFYFDKETNVEKLLATTQKTGFEDRKIEGLAPNTSFLKSPDYSNEVMKRFSEHPFEVGIVSPSFETEGTRENISLETLGDRTSITKENLDDLRLLNITDRQIFLENPLAVYDSGIIDEMTIDSRLFLDTFLSKRVTEKVNAKDNSYKEKFYAYLLRNTHYDNQLKVVHFLRDSLIQADNIESFESTSRILMPEFCGNAKIGFVSNTNLSTLEKSKVFSKIINEIDFQLKEIGEYKKQPIEKALTEKAMSIDNKIINRVKEKHSLGENADLKLHYELAESIVNNQKVVNFTTAMLIIANKTEDLSTLPLLKVKVEDMFLKQDYMQRDKLHVLNKEDIPNYKDFLYKIVNYTETVSHETLTSNIKAKLIKALDYPIIEDTINNLYALKPTKIEVGLNTLSYLLKEEREPSSDMFIRKLSYIKAYDEKDNSILNNAELFNRIFGKDDTNKSYGLSVFIKKSIVEGDASSFKTLLLDNKELIKNDFDLSHLLLGRVTSLQEKTVLSDIPDLNKVKSSLESFVFPKDLTKLSLEEFADEVENLPRLNKGIIFQNRVTRELAKENQVEKIKILLNKAERNARSSHIITLAREVQKGTLPKSIDEEINLDDFCFYFNDISESKLVEINNFKDLVSYLRINTDQNILNASKKISSNNFYKYPDTNSIWEKGTKTYVQELHAKSLVFLMVASEEIKISSLENFKSNRKIVREIVSDSARKLQTRQTSSLFYSKNDLCNSHKLKLDTKEEYQLFADGLKQKITSNFTKEEVEEDEHQKYFFEIIDKKTSNGKNITIGDLDTSKLLDAKNSGNIENRAIKALSLLSLIKEDLLKSDEEKHTLSTTCDTISERLFLLTGQLSLAGKQELLQKETLIANIQKGIEFAVTLSDSNPDVLVASNNIRDENTIKEVLALVKPEKVETSTLNPTR